MPGSTTEAPVLCTTCPSPYTNLPTQPYALPLKKHIGRYNDGNAIRNYTHGYGHRSIRAREIIDAPEHDAIYILMGDDFAKYRRSKFFTHELGKPLSTAPGFADGGGQREGYLAWIDAVYPESQGWQTIVVEGQHRLFGGDYDGRGNVIVAYTLFGWRIMRDKGGDAGFEPLSKQIFTQGVSPRKAIVIKSGESYYVLLSDNGNSALYNITNPANPTFIHYDSFGVQSWARAPQSNSIAIVDHLGKLRIYTYEQLIAKAAPRFITPTKESFTGVTSDGRNFFAVQRTEFSGMISVLAADSSGNFTESRHEIGAINTQGTHWGAGYLTVWGYETSGWGNLRLYKIENLVPREIDLGNFFTKYYNNPPAGYAKPDGFNSIAHDAMVIREGGKDYLVFSMYGMGDVYELVAGDTLDIVRRAGPFGEVNPNSTTNGQGPFLGDVVTFGSTSSKPSVTVRWTFGNPESSDNTVDRLAGTDVQHQYANLLTATAITAPKTVRGVDTLDSTVASEITVNLLAPAARVGVKNLNLLFTQQNASAAPIIPGDQLMDASDGSVRSHYNVWTVGGTSLTAQPSALVDVGLCGSRNLSLQTRYVPYDVVSGAIVPRYSNDKHYVLDAGPFAYNVRPFAAAITSAPPSSGDTVTFQNATRFTPSIPLTAPITVTWKLNGTAMPGSASPTVGNPGTVTISKSLITDQSTLELTVSIDTSHILETSCKAYVSSSSSKVLRIPDPRIDIVSGCTNAGSPCNLTVASISGASDSDWTYQWKRDGSVVSTAKTYSPTFSAAGTYTIEVAVTNPVRSVTASTTLNIQPSVCTNPPALSSIQYRGLNSGCLGSACTTNEPFEFKAYAFIGTYQPCDNFEWNLAGTVKQGQIVTHTFVGNGPHLVKLRVYNTNGEVTDQTTLQFGSGPVTPPPPQPTCNAPSSLISLNFTGTTSGCNVANNSCRTNEQIDFAVSKFDGTQFQSCDAITWTFPDGTTASGRLASKRFTTNGAHLVRVTIANTYGSANSQVTVNTSGGTDTPPNPGTCSQAPQGIGIVFNGPTSGCALNNGRACSRDETLTLYVTGFHYTFCAGDVVEWNFDDGTPIITGLNVTHKFEGAKAEYNVVATVKNNIGTASGSVKIPFAGAAATPPSGVSVSGPTSVAANEPVTFTASAAAGDPATSWLWNFGDGSAPQTTTGATVTHIFTQAGTFNVSVVGRNAGGDGPPSIKVVTVIDGRPFAYMLPVVTHIQGRNGSSWRTDLHVYDPNHTGSQARNLKLTVEFAGRVKELEVNASTFIYPDFLSFFTTENDFGPVKISGTAAAAPQIWTSTYNLSADGGTFGQIIPAVPMHTGELTAGESAYIAAGARQDQNYRTNAGVVNMSPIGTRVTVTAYDDRFELPIGSFTETVDAFQLLLISNLDRRIPDLPLRPFTLTFSSDNGVPLTAYISVVDNITNDARFLLAEPDSRFTAAALRQQVVPVIAPSAEWRTDLTVYNLHNGPLQFRIAFYDAGGTKLKESPFMTVNARSFAYLEDVLFRTLELTSPTNGILRIETTSTVTKYPLVAARTYKVQNGGGTYGQGMVAFAAEQTNVNPGQPGFIAAVKNDGNTRTKIGLVNAGNESGLVRVALLDSTSGAEIGTWTWGLNPNSSVVRDIFEAMTSTAQKGTLKIEVTGGAAWAFASMEDLKTGDIEYIPAAPQQ